MKKGLIAIIVAVVLIAGVTAVVIMRNKKSPAPAASSSSSAAASSNSPAPTASDAVTIKDFAFAPNSITVRKGATVTWTNNGGTAHTITGDTATGPQSGTIDPGKTYSFTFNTVGTFSYHCSIHSSMTGTVVVTE